MHIKKTVLACLLLAALVLVSCGEDSETDILDAVPNLNVSKEVSTEVSEPDPPPAEGQTAMPSVVQFYNSDKDTVVIAGTCEDGAAVTASAVGGAEKTVTASGSVFALEIDVGTRTNAGVQLVAKAPGKRKSEAKAVICGCNPVSEGNLVYPTILTDKVTLFLKSSLAILGDGSVRSNTAVEKFTSKINDYVRTLKTRSDTELIYLLIPSKASGMTDSLPEELRGTSKVTIYDQAVRAIENSGATLIDMKKYLAEKELADYPLFYRTHSVWSEYGAYLAYEALMEHIAEKYPDAAPRPLKDFDIKTVDDALGGDLAYHFGLDAKLVREPYCEFVPKFDLKIGDSAPEGTEVKKPHLISDIKKYVGDGDFRFFNAYFAGKQIYKDPELLRVDESFGFYTGRGTLPTALFYRDQSTYAIADILAERFNNCMFESALSYNVNTSKAVDYAAAGKKNVDYVVVMISEDNLPSLIPNNG